MAGFCREEMQKSVSEMLDKALKDGILDEACKAPPNILPFPLPSCPTLSCNVLKRQVSDLLEDGVASGTFGVQQAERLRDLIMTYNKAHDRMADGPELLMPHLSDVQAEKLVSGFHGEINDPEAIMRDMLENALESGILEQSLKEAQFHGQPEEASGVELFNFAPSERLVDQPNNSKSSKMDLEVPMSPADHEKYLQAQEKISDMA